MSLVDLWDVPHREWSQQDVNASGDGPETEEGEAAAGGETDEAEDLREDATESAPERHPDGFVERPQHSVLTAFYCSYDDLKNKG